MLKQLALTAQAFSDRLDRSFTGAGQAMDPDRRVIFLAVMLGLPIGAMMGNSPDDALAAADAADTAPIVHQSPPIAAASATDSEATG